MANSENVDASSASENERLRFSVSLVRQGRHSFYTLTMPSNVLARTCVVSSRKEDPKHGFQRVLDEKRALEIANYIDTGMGTIPNSIVLSAQPAANLKVIGRGKTLEFSDTPGAFLILDGQHRVYGFSKASTQLRVPVVVYNGLSRRDESRLFIDINTKQRPVPAQLLLDIKQLADIEDESEGILREVFDSFNSDIRSSLFGMMAPYESVKNKITRVTFNSAVKPLLEIFSGRDIVDIYDILNNYLSAVRRCVDPKWDSQVVAKPVVFRALMGLFPSVAQRVLDRFSGDYSEANFFEIVSGIFAGMPKNKLDVPGTSWVALRDYFEKRLRSKLTL
ncbi:DGQHR domain-containing protein [Mesorhizobium sp. B2-3-14]|uniref:DGQHR domain-containing protein n=1 Tax=Mesorhizobium sp. B2-3-14 TaxID=2589950 RepID=UPI001127DD7F|nr:DGQHR domain-containing protein [Mesorhizobium sp. B2-3-14]TPL84084.1 DGQHR domain-containing protein [Mesorhizobium sp. B2-3-14]